MSETLKNMYKLLIDDSLSESFKDYIYEEMLKLVMEVQVNYLRMESYQDVPCVSWSMDIIPMEFI